MESGDVVYMRSCRTYEPSRATKGTRHASCIDWKVDDGEAMCFVFIARVNGEISQEEFEKLILDWADQIRAGKAAAEEPSPVRDKDA